MGGRSGPELTEEPEGPPHQRVEVTAVAGGHCLLRPVELFGRVLDQEQHRLSDGDLVEKNRNRNQKRKKTQRRNISAGFSVRQGFCFSPSVTQLAARVTDSQWAPSALTRMCDAQEHMEERKSAHPPPPPPWFSS